jgi:hypothetical protein
MKTSEDWMGLERSLEQRLLAATGVNADRAILLIELSKYARAVVLESHALEQVRPDAQDQARCSAWLDQPVFICGHHRSGTTLLQQLLDAHPELLVLPSEGTYFKSFGYVAHADPAPRDIDRFIEDWIARLVDPNQEPHFKLGRSGAGGNPYLMFARRLTGWTAVLSARRDSLSRFAVLRALAAAYRDVTATPKLPRYWVEKTPLNERYFERFAVFPQARFIQLVRAPRATIASLLKLYRSGGVGDFDLSEHARAIAQSLTLAQKHRAQSDRYLVVRYEDLTQDPAREMQRVCQFLGVSSAAVLLTPSVGGKTVRSNSSFEKGAAGVIQRSHQLLTLTADEEQVISTFTAAAAQPFGYDVLPVSTLTRASVYMRYVLPNTARRILMGALRGRR